MFRYIGIRCPDPECKAFLIWKELKPSDPPATVKSFDVVSGKCPKCSRQYSCLASEMVEIESESRLTNTLPQRILQNRLKNPPTHF